MKEEEVREEKHRSNRNSGEQLILAPPPDSSLTSCIIGVCCSCDTTRSLPPVTDGCHGDERLLLLWSPSCVLPLFLVPSSSGRLELFSARTSHWTRFNGRYCLLSPPDEFSQCQ